MQVKKVIPTEKFNFSILKLYYFRKHYFELTIMNSFLSNRNSQSCLLLTMLCSNGQKIKGKKKKPFLLHNLTRDGGDADHKRLQRGGGRKLL